jgi:hypothetical protein
MKSKVVYILLVLLPFMALCQNVPRQVLRGQIIADSLEVEGISVKNISTNIGAVSDNLGNFALYARPADTLLFSSISYRPARLILTKEDLELDKIIVQLDVNVIVMDELVIAPNRLSGDLNSDSKKTKIKKLLPDYDAEKLLDPNSLRNYKYSYINTAMPQTESSLQGINIIKLGKLLFKSKKSKPAPVKDSSNSLPFAVVVKERFTYHFFTETLKIPHEEIGLFIAFCDQGAETNKLLDVHKEFELTEYLVTKGKEYLKNDK